MDSDITPNTILNYIVLVDKVNDIGDSYRIGEYSGDGFIDDSKHVIKEHKGITNIREAKLFLCAKMEPNPRKDIESTVQRVTERVDSINDAEELDRVAGKVNQSIN